MRQIVRATVTFAALAALAACQTTFGPSSSKPVKAPADAPPAIGGNLPEQVPSDVPSGLPIDEMPLPEGEFTFAGGDGTSLDQAVIVNAPSEQVGVAAVYGWIGRHYPNSTTAGQNTVIQKGRYFDAIDVVTGTKERRTFYFDITQFFGKFQAQ